MSKIDHQAMLNRLLERLEREETDLPCTLLSAILAMVTTGRFELLENIFKTSLDKELHPSLIYEILLQSHLFAGFPRAINGLQIFHDTLVRSGRCPEDYQEEAMPDRDRARQERGKKLFQTVYGENAERVLNSLHSLYPQYDRWILEDAYGRVLSRPLLSGKMRELCAVAALTASGVPRQLKSHIMGAINLGAGLDEVKKAIQNMEPLLERKKIDDALAILAGLALK